MPDRRAHARRDAWIATAAYCAATLVMTWPLATGLARDVAWDLGDSLLNMWTLAWDCEQFRAVLGGDIGRIRTFFDANIFYPAPLTLAYSEHLFAQAVQIFPVYLVTKNPILCYNLLFVSTFVLSGLGMYLLVREVTGRPRAAFVAGLVFAFVPYRLVQAAHLQVLSSQWMPLALYGFRRYIDSGRRLPLWGGTGTCHAAISCCTSRRSPPPTCCGRSPHGRAGATTASGSISWRLPRSPWPPPRRS
jgi:hypothetical protein